TVRAVDRVVEGADRPVAEGRRGAARIGVVVEAQIVRDHAVPHLGQITFLGCDVTDPDRPGLDRDGRRELEGDPAPSLAGVDGYLLGDAEPRTRLPGRIRVHDRLDLLCARRRSETRDVARHLDD